MDRKGMQEVVYLRSKQGASEYFLLLEAQNKQMDMINEAFFGASTELKERGDSIGVVGIDKVRNEVLANVIIENRDEHSLGVKCTVIISNDNRVISQVMVGGVDETFPAARLVRDGDPAAIAINIIAEKDPKWLETLETVYAAACDSERNPVLAEVISSLEQ